MKKKREKNFTIDSRLHFLCLNWNRPALSQLLNKWEMHWKLGKIDSCHVEILLFWKSFCSRYFSSFYIDQPESHLGTNVIFQLLGLCMSNWKIIYHLKSRIIWIIADQYCFYFKFIFPIQIGTFLLFVQCSHMTP